MSSNQNVGDQASPLAFARTLLAAYGHDHAFVPAGKLNGYYAEPAFERACSP